MGVYVWGLRSCDLPLGLDIEETNGMAWASRTRDGGALSTNGGSCVRGPKVTYPPSLGLPAVTMSSSNTTSQRSTLYGIIIIGSY